MPEAAVDEHHDLGSPEHDVRSGPTFRMDLLVDAEPQTSHVQEGPEEPLRLRVSPTLGLHPRFDCRGSGQGHGNEASVVLEG